jgi:coenzyme F420-0:L-glutamate ligase / coenzyme F420-1:gamma-L-glutamate ligase
MSAADVPETYSTLLALMRDRRSVRRFRSQALPPGTPDLLVEAARWAPSASNRQPFRFVVVERPDTRARMAALVREAVAKTVERLPENQQSKVAAYAKDFSGFAEAPLVLAAYHRSTNLLAELVGLPAEADVGAVSSVAAAIMNLLLAAHALGLGACWMTGPLVAAPALQALLEIPAGWQLSALIPVGIPDETPPAPARRTPAQLLRHHGGST